MSAIIVSANSVQMRRLARNWSQAELAERVGISRAAVSAIEGERLSPSVATALALADVLDCSVEELFGKGRTSKIRGSEWAWKPRNETSRYWEAEIGRRRLVYPVEALSLNPAPHDGVWTNGVFRECAPTPAERTLTLASCDPAGGLLASEYTRATGFRLLVFPRGGSVALELLRQNLVHVAAVHRATDRNPGRNAEAVRKKLGEDFQLLRAAEWEEGLALPVENSSRSARLAARHTKCWAGREIGSGARECLDELLEGRKFTGRELTGHSSVAEAVRSGWAEAGICVRLSAEEVGLNFLPVRTEALDLCFPVQSQHDPRVQGLIGLLRSRGYRRLVSDLPGYDARRTGEMLSV